MAVDVVMPQMGESIFEGTITKWLKKPGDSVERDEPLFEISTDKVDAEIPSPAAGVLREIKVAEGQTVPMKTVVAVIDAAGRGTRPATPRLRKQKELRQQRQLRADNRRHARLRLVPKQRAHAAAGRQSTAKRSAARRWCGAWRGRTTSISPPCAARESAGASARTTSWRRSRVGRSTAV